MIASLEGNIVVVCVLLEQGSENDNFGLSLDFAIQHRQMPQQYVDPLF